jgi:GH15 family glucan-1,4-alpha-glucosidase
MSPLVTLLATLALAAPDPAHTSYDKLVTANGWGAFVFAGDRLSDGYPNLYQAWDPDTWTPEVLYDTYFGVTDGAGAGEWLTEAGDATYRPGTNVITVTRRAGDLEVTEHAFAPMDLAAPAVAQVARVRNVGDRVLAPRQIVLLANWHVGGREEVQSPSAQAWIERGTDTAWSAWAHESTDVSCDGVYDAVRAGRRIGGGCNTSGTDVVPAFGWTLPALGPGEEAWVGAVSGEGIDGEAWAAGRTPDRWVEDEVAGWEALHAQSAAPADMTDDERAVYRQALAFLLMGQVQEPGEAFGQLPASLPLSAPVGDFQHVWNITWVRDASYGAAALARAGFPQRALDALAFMAQPGKTGEWQAYVGGPHALSICRVYGNGLEWTDPDADGPNIEFDNFGLWLWALGEARAAGAEPPPALVDTALDGVADVLVRLIDPNTGLLLPDSSIWERHWNGNQQQFTYSSAWAVAGLRVAADLADARGDTRADTYRAAADRIATAIGVHLVDASGVVAASREQLASGGDYLDLAAVEVFNLGILEATDPSFQASVAAWDEGLRVAHGNGYARNDDGSVYDQHEWLVMDLRLAEALRRGCEPEAAAALETWVTAVGRANDDILPELLHPERADFAGPAPMLGFGAGAWVLAMHGRAPADAACADARAAQESSPEPIGCGCTTVPGTEPLRTALPWAGVALLAAVARRRGARGEP